LAQARFGRFRGAGCLARRNAITPATKTRAGTGAIGLSRKPATAKPGLKALCLNLRKKTFFLEHFVGIPEAAILAALTNASSESQYFIQLNNMDFRAQNPATQVGAIMQIAVNKNDSESTTPSLPTQ
jgi:hypothetical protein